MLLSCSHDTCWETHRTDVYTPWDSVILWLLHHKAEGARGGHHDPLLCSHLESPSTGMRQTHVCRAAGRVGTTEECLVDISTSATGDKASQTVSHHTRKQNTINDVLSTFAKHWFLPLSPNNWSPWTEGSRKHDVLTIMGVSMPVSQVTI